MKEIINKIKEEWNAKVGVPLNDSPTVIHRDQGMLMFKLMYEELLEFKDAIQDEGCTDQERMVEVADALGDLFYLLAGTVSQYGLQEHFKGVVDEIHRSNQTKLVDGEILRRDDGKILKPKTFELPNIAKVLFDD